MGVEQGERGRSETAGVKRTMFVPLVAKTSKSLELVDPLGKEVPLKVVGDLAPDYWLPVYLDRERAERLNPDVPIMELYEDDGSTG